VWSGQVVSGRGQVKSGCGQVNFEIRRTKYHLVSFREIWNEILFFQVAAISKRFELRDCGWAHPLCLLKNVVIDLHKDNIIEKSTGRTAF
jgi:hypothetical protein